MTTSHLKSGVQANPNTSSISAMSEKVNSVHQNIGIMNEPLSQNSGNLSTDYNIITGRPLSTLCYIQLGLEQKLQ
jgi:hypothetical protein